MLNITAGRDVPAISQQISDIATYLEQVIKRHRNANPEMTEMLMELQVVKRALRYLATLARRQEALGGPWKEQDGHEGAETNS